VASSWVRVANHATSPIAAAKRTAPPAMRRTERRLNPAGSVVTEDLAAFAGAEAGPGSRVDRVANEAYGTVAEEGIDAADVPAARIFDMVECVVGRAAVRRFTDVHENER